MGRYGGVLVLCLSLAPFGSLPGIPGEASAADCTEETCGGGGGGGSGTPSGYSASRIGFGAECWNNYWATDRDRDGLNDDCEAALAREFIPRYWFDSGENSGCDGWYPHFAVRSDSAAIKTVQLIVLHSFYRDCGAFSGHNGDSEFVRIWIVWDGAAWKVQKMYTAAHWHATWDSSRTTDYWGLEYVDSYRGRPYVYVAEDKHGSYPTDQKCDEGAGYSDNCSRSYLKSMSTTRNVGRYNYQLINASLHNGGTEHYWFDPNGSATIPPKFCGWRSRSSSCPTAYGEVLTHYSFW